MDSQKNDDEIMPLKEIARTDLAEDFKYDRFERPHKLDKDGIWSRNCYAVEKNEYQNENEDMTSDYNGQGVMVKLCCSYTNVSKSHIKQTKCKEKTVDNEGPICGNDNTTDTSAIEQMKLYPSKETEGMINEYEKSDKHEEIIFPETSETECNEAMLIQGKEDMLYKYEKSEKQEEILIPEKSKTECNKAMLIQGKEGMINEYEKSDKHEEILFPETSETECNEAMLIQGKEDMPYKYEKSEKQEEILIPEKSENECNKAMLIQGKEATSTFKETSQNSIEKLNQKTIKSKNRRLLQKKANIIAKNISPCNTPFLIKNSKETVRPQQPRTSNKSSTTKDRLKYIQLIKEVKSQRKMFVNSRKSLNQIVNESKFEARTRDEKVTKTKVKNKDKKSNNKCGGTSRTKEMVYDVRQNSCFRERTCKGVRYLRISYLLLVLFLVPVTSQTTVKWSFKGFLSSLNDSAILRCSTDNMAGMCDKSVVRRWTKGSMQSTLVFNGLSTNKTKYQEVLGDNCTHSILLIKHLNDDDINEFYTCAYGFAEETKNFTLDANALRSYTLKDDVIKMEARYTKGKLLLNLSIKRAYPTPRCNILIENKNISYKTKKKKHGIFVSIDFSAKYQLNANFCNGSVNGVCYFGLSKMNVHNQTFDYCTEFGVDGEKRNSAGYICLGVAVLIVVVIIGLGKYRRVICRRNRMENCESKTQYNVLCKSWRELDEDLVNATLKISGENHCNA